MSRSGTGSLPRRIHMVGIGGIGLSAIARVLAGRGHIVSGSDLRASTITRDLNSLGIEPHVGHLAEQVAGAELVVISSAIPKENVEVQAARAAGIPVVKRQQLLGPMMAGSYGIAVAGTHGKTTTAAMLAVILERLGYSPTFIVGGIIAELGTNAQAGGGPYFVPHTGYFVPHAGYFVIEADEYDRTFHGLRPHVAVVTNVEMDHPDCYPSIEDVRLAFGIFLERVPDEGHIVACADSPELMRVLGERGGGLGKVKTYGLSPDADYVISDVKPELDGGVAFKVVRAGRTWGTFLLVVPGLHNALNATAALIVAGLLGVEPSEAGAVLSRFRGVERRFEVRGEVAGIFVVDDYAHHPTQVRATLAAARQRYPGRRIWAVFQPHTFSRTRALLNEFATCFAGADRVIVTDIYAARSHEKPTINAERLVETILHDKVRHISELDEVVRHLVGELCEGDVVLTLGAGDCYLISERVLEELAKRGEA